jgi:hypothetical protein
MGSAYVYEDFGGEMGRYRWLRREDGTELFDMVGFLESICRGRDRFCMCCAATMR